MTVGRCRLLVEDGRPLHLHAYRQPPAKPTATNSQSTFRIDLDLYLSYFISDARSTPKMVHEDGLAGFTPEAHDHSTYRDICSYILVSQ